MGGREGRRGGRKDEMLIATCAQYMMVLLDSRWGREGGREGGREAKK